MISLIAALGKDGGIGHKNELLWRIPADLIRFRNVTMGNPVIVGRPTFEGSMGGKPLPGRTTIVLTRNARWSANGVVVATTLDDAFKIAVGVGTQEIFVAGGAQVYQQVINDAQRVYLTLVDAVKPADAFFPRDWNMEFDERLSDESGIYQGIRYRFVVDQRG